MDAPEPPEQRPLPPIEVGIFTPRKAGEPEQVVAPQRRPSRRMDWGALFPRRGRTGSAVCGVVIAALHILIVTPLLPGGHARKVLHAMGSVSGADAEPAIQVSLIEELPLALVPPPPTTAVTIQMPRLPELEPPPDLLKSIPDKPSANSAVDAAGSSALAGRYLGQIDARIERAWLKPRTSVDSGVFHCEVRVEQDATGKVLEIALEQCGGDTRWQQSLVRAIQSASPLPAPPDPSVFRKSLHLSFTGRAYSAQGSEQGYESLAASNSQLP